MTRTLILGGARSGKSAMAERLAAASGKEVVYIATATAGDGEMAARIGEHRARRPAHWRTIEEPALLGGTIDEWCTPQRVILIDCLTLWLSNVMFGAEGDAQFRRERELLIDALKRARGEVLLVTNEVGMGIVPMGAVSRAFADEAGRLNQAVAGACEHAVMMVAGLPLTLKGRSC